jgi:GABA permease
VRNPLRSEAEAFRLVVLTLGAFAAIAVASLLGGVWVGVPVWALLTAAAAFFYLRRRGTREIPTAPPHVGGADERQVLVVLDGAVAGETTAHEIERASAGYRTRVLVLCPARVSPLDHWTSAVDGARAQAQSDLDESLARLRTVGIDARGEIGDEDPLRAIEDALRTFGADAIVVVTPADGEGEPSRDVAAGARARFALPVTHVVAGAQVTALLD